MRGYNCHEKIEVHRTTNRVRLKADGDRHSGGGSLPQDRYLGGDLFQLEAEVFRLNEGVTVSSGYKKNLCFYESFCCLPHWDFASYVFG